MTVWKRHSYETMEEVGGCQGPVGRDERWTTRFRTAAGVRVLTRRWTCDVQLPKPAERPTPRANPNVIPGLWC